MDEDQGLNQMSRMDIFYISSLYVNKEDIGFNCRKVTKGSLIRKQNSANSSIGKVLTIQANQRLLL